MSIVNQMIVIYSYPYYDEQDRDNPIIGNLVRAGYSSVEDYFEFFGMGSC